MPTFDEYVLSWQEIEAEGGRATYAEVARRFGVDESTVRRSLQAGERRQEDAAWADRAEQNGFNPSYGGWNRIYNEDGKILASVQVPKKQLEQDDQTQRVIDRVSVAFERYAGMCPLIAPPPEPSKDLLHLINAADIHLGMFAWAQEAGENYNLKIARRQFREATQSLVHRSPSCKRCTLLINGDYLHAENDENRTPAHKHALDGDGRHAKVLDTGVELLVDLAELAAQKHDEVDIIVNVGNHDPIAAIAVRIALKYAFRNTPRIKVCESPEVWWADVWGKNLLVASHGHTLRGGNKRAQAVRYVSQNFRRQWGQTDFTYIFLGHDHHEVTHDEPGANVETSRPFTPRDAHAAGGYCSEREISGITFCKKRGRRGRNYEALPLSP